MNLQHKVEYVAGELSPGLAARLSRRRLARAAVHRRSLGGTVFIGVTGSSGKTTTKELIAAVLSARFPGRKSPDSLNWPGTVARTILGTTSEDRYCVVEVTATFPGMVQEAAGLLRPDVAVVTTIGTEHYRSFRTKEAIAGEKSALVAALPVEGTAVLNAEDPYVASMRELARGRVVTFGVGADATLRAEDVHSAWPDRLTFTLRCDGRSFPVATRLCGAQWTHAVLAALAVGHVLGVPLEAGIAAVESFEPIAGRMSVVEDRGVTFIRDDWKAPLWSFDRVLDFMRDARAARKVIVVGTISDYGGKASRVYPRLAERALGVADEVVFVGPQARLARRARAGSDAGVLHAFPSVREAAEHVRATVRDGDLVLVKGSFRADHLLRVILARQETIRCWREACGRMIFCDICQLRRVPDRFHLGLSRAKAGSPRSRGTRARA